MNQLPNFVDGNEGTIYDLPDADYRAASGVSNSMLKAIALDGDEPGSPAHFVQSFLDPKTDTDALFMGRMVHSRILTPDEPIPGVIEIPETYTNEKGEVKPWSGNAKVCKAWLAKQEAAGLRPMKVEQIAAMDGIVNAIAQNDDCKAIFADGKPEVSLFKRWYRNDGMILRKARMDWVPRYGPLVDIKTCLDARACDFDSTMWKRRYYVQADYYLTLWNELNPDDQRTGFVFIAVEKFAPFSIQIFQVDQSDLDNGRREWQRNLSLVIECLKTGSWPGYQGGIKPIKVRYPYNRKTILPE